MNVLYVHFCERETDGEKQKKRKEENTTKHTNTHEKK